MTTNPRLALLLAPALALVACGGEGGPGADPSAVLAAAAAPNWWKVVGASGTDGNVGAASNGSAVVTAGMFHGTVDFDPSGGVDNKTSAGGADVFITQFAQNGNYGWTRRFGGAQDDYGSTVLVLSDGSSLVAGTFQGSVDFGNAGSPDVRTSAGGEDIFLVRLSSSGSTMWTRTWGGNGTEWPNDIANGPGGIVLTGIFNSDIDLDPTAGTDMHTSAGLEDVFVVKLTSGGSYVWGRAFGGTDYDYGNGVTVDSDGSAIVTGYFQNTVNFGGGDFTSAGVTDGFVTKLSSSGATTWTKTFGGSDYDYGMGVAVSGSGAVWVSGAFTGTADMAPQGAGALRTAAAHSDGMVIGYTSGGSFKSVRTISGPGYEEASAVAIGSGNIVVVGDFSGTTNFDPGGTNTSRTASGPTNGFILTLDGAGSYVRTRVVPSTGYAYAADITAVTDGTYMVAGYFTGTLQTGGPGKVSAGDFDGFLRKCDP